MYRQRLIAFVFGLGLEFLVFSWLLMGATVSTSSPSFTSNSYVRMEPVVKLIIHAWSKTF